MSREFTMGIRLNYHDNSFSKGIREATRQTNSFRDGMAQATRNASGFTSAIGAAAVALGGMAAAKKGFSWLVGANADMEQYQNTLTVVMKSQEEAAKTLTWANKFAAQTPFEIPQIVEATTRMSAYGIETQKTLGIVGDMASVMGKDLMQAVEAVADAQTGELERLKEFGITKNMIQEQAKLLGSNPINNQGSITDQKAFNAALFSLMEQRFKGGMEMQSKSYKGMISNVKDFIGSMGRQLGQPLFDKTKKQLQGLLATLNQLQDNGTLDAWIKQAQQAGAAVGRVFQGAYRVAVAAFRGIGAVAGPIIDGIRKHWATWQPIIQTLGYSLAVFTIALGGVKAALLAANTGIKLLNATMLTSPIGWIALGVGLLVGAFIQLNGGIDGAKNRIMGWVSTAKKSEILVKIIQAIKENWFMVLGALPALFIKLNGGIDGTKQKLASWFTALAAWYKSDTTQAWINRIVTGFKQLVDMAGTAFSWLQAQAAKYWPTIQAVIGSVVQDVVSGFAWLAAMAVRFWPMVRNMVVGVWTDFQTIVLPAAKQLLTTVVNAFMSIAKAVGPLVQAIYGFVKAILPSLVLIGGMVVWLVMRVIWPMAMVIIRTVMGIANTIIPVVANIVTKIIGAFTQVLNWFKVIWPAVTKIVAAFLVFFQFIWAAIGPFIMAALKVISGIIVGGFQVIMSVVQFIWTTISSIIQVAWAVISGIITTALGILTGDWAMAWEGFKSIFTGVWDGITNFLGGVGKLFYDSGKAIINTLVDGIKSVASAPVDAVKGVLGKVREFLPFSDAKKGPLSELTYSGGAIMTTLSTGVNKQASALADSVRGAFDTSGLVSPAMAVSHEFSTAAVEAPRMASTPSFSAEGLDIPANRVTATQAPAASAGKASAPVINVGGITIHASEGMDTDTLVYEVVDKMYDKMKAAANNLATADKGLLFG